MMAVVIITGEAKTNFDTIHQLLENDKLTITRRTSVIHYGQDAIMLRIVGGADNDVITLVTEALGVINRMYSGSGSIVGRVYN